MCTHVEVKKGWRRNKYAIIPSSFVKCTLYISIGFLLRLPFFINTYPLYECYHRCWRNFLSHPYARTWRGEMWNQLSIRYGKYAHTNISMMMNYVRFRREMESNRDEEDVMWSLTIFIILTVQQLYSNEWCIHSTWRIQHEQCGYCLFLCPRKAI
jgi:hypothetical protein